MYLTLAVATMTDMTVVVFIVYDSTDTIAMRIIIMQGILSGRIHTVKVVMWLHDCHVTDMTNMSLLIISQTHNSCVRITDQYQYDANIIYHHHHHQTNLLHRNAKHN